MSGLGFRIHYIGECIGVFFWDIKADTRGLDPKP